MVEVLGSGTRLHSLRPDLLSNGERVGGVACFHAVALPVCPGACQLVDHRFAFVLHCLSWMHHVSTWLSTEIMMRRSKGWGIIYVAGGHLPLVSA